MITLNITSQDASGNLTSSSLNLVRDVSPPSISVGTPSRSVVNASNAVTYSLTISDLNGVSSTALSATDIALVKTGTANCNKTLNGSGLDRTLTLSGCTGSGTIAFSIAGGVATDVAGNLSAATPASGLVSVDAVPPVVQIGVPSLAVANQSGIIQYQEDFIDNIGINAVDFSIPSVTLNFRQWLKFGFNRWPCRDC